MSTSASSPCSTSQLTACSTLSVPVLCSARTALLREKPIASSSASLSALTSGSTCPPRELAEGQAWGFLLNTGSGVLHDLAGGCGRIATRSAEGLGTGSSQR